jgi:predicted secreted protein
LIELKDIKPGKRSEEYRLEMERLWDSIEAEETRQETQETQEAINAFYRGMAVQYPPALQS